MKRSSLYKLGGASMAAALQVPMGAWIFANWGGWSTIWFVSACHIGVLILTGLATNWWVPDWDRLERGASTEDRA